MGWADVLQKAGGAANHIAHAVARASGGVLVPMPPDLGEIDNADINQRLLEALEQIAAQSKQVREAIDDELYLVISKLQEHATLVYRIYCEAEKVNALSCSSGRSGATKTCVEK